MNLLPGGEAVEDWEAAAPPPRVDIKEVKLMMVAQMQRGKSKCPCAPNEQRVLTYYLITVS